MFFMSVLSNHFKYEEKFGYGILNGDRDINKSTKVWHETQAEKNMRQLPNINYSQYGSD